MSKETSWALSLALGGQDIVEEMRSPIGDAKALKNGTELKGMRECHIRDGAALIEYFAWLEDQLINQKTKLDEVEAADKLEELRSTKEHFVGLSFPTISSTGANAAVIHYQPERGNCSTIDPTKIYLCDSGAQYLDGTTDTTRTLHFGEPTEMEKMAYTNVLKGNIALEVVKFPKGTSGYALDALARQFLWQQGLDYRHGTGHGVGSFLVCVINDQGDDHANANLQNVHEGPIGIGTRVQYTDVPLAPGNVISDEPGYYEDNGFGIRIESECPSIRAGTTYADTSTIDIIMVKEVETKYRFGDKPFLGFEHVTMVPMCRKLIDPTLLTKEEKQFINEYHEEVQRKTKGYFKGDEKTLAWLERETQPL